MKVICSRSLMISYGYLRYNTLINHVTCSFAFGSHLTMIMSYNVDIIVRSRKKWDMFWV